MSMSATPFAAWPQRDQQHWQAATAPAAFLEAGGALSGKSAERLRRIARAYGQWLAFVEAELPGVCSGTALMNRDHLQAFCARLNDTYASHTVAACLFPLWQAAEALAADGDFSILKRAALASCGRARTQADKRARMVSADRLLSLGFELMAEAAHIRRPLDAALCYRDGLIIALLINCPVRRANLAAITIGRHLQRDDDRYRLSFAAAEMKARRSYSALLPLSLTPVIEHYIAQYRPTLLTRAGRWHRGGAGDALWVSSHGSAMRPGPIGEVIAKRTEAAFGRSINPHLFRDIAITTIAEAAPREVRIMGDVLGHANPRTAERHYLHADGLDASRRLGMVLMKVKEIGGG